MAVKKNVKSPENNNLSDGKMALGMRNYKLMLIGFAIVVLGLILMTGGGTDSPTEFNYEMFSFRRITLSTIIVLGGFAFVGYAIMSKGKEVKSKDK